MSRFSGEDDFFDCMMRIGGAKDSSKEAELEAFENFKRQTGGIIYQTFPVKVTLENIDYIEKENPFLAHEVRTEMVPDKRCKSGYRAETVHDFFYFAHHFYSLEELNKKKTVYTRVGFKFDDIFDLMPIYPYKVAIASRDSSRDYAFVELGINEEFRTARLARDVLVFGKDINPLISSKELTRHFIEMCNYVQDKKEEGTAYVF